MQKEFKKRILSSLILLPLSFFFILKGSLFFSLFLFICFLIASYEWFKMTKKKNYQLIGQIFLVVSFYSVNYIRNHIEDDGLFLFLLVIVTCISTDIGGYVFGKVFKGPKLTKISPNKTVSGMIGGYILSILTIYILYNYSILFNDTSSEIDLRVLTFVFAISTVSQIGDIIVSYFNIL